MTGDIEMKYIYSFLCLFLLSGVAGAEYPKWICVADHVTGFTYKDDHWIQVNFRPEDEKYIVSFDTDVAAYTVKQVGDTERHFSCAKTELNPRLVPLYFECQRTVNYQVIADEDPTAKVVGTFSFNSTNGRFLTSQLYGYWNVGWTSESKNLRTDENSSTPYVEIGKCSSF